MPRLSTTTPNRPTIYKPQTTTQARATYRKYGPRPSSQEVRRLERGHVLMVRAQQIKEKERRKKENARRRSEKELRTRDARRNQGLSSQEAPKVRASQRLIVGFVKDAPTDDEVTEPEPAAENHAQARDEDADHEEELFHLVHSSHNGKVSQKDQSSPASTDVKKACSRTFDPMDDFGVLEDLVASCTQIAREIASSPRRSDTIKPETPRPPSMAPPLIVPRSTDLNIDLESISTQDISLDDSDLDDIGIPQTTVLVPVIELPQSTKRFREKEKYLSPKTVMHPPLVILSDGLEDAFELSTQDRREICS